MHKLRGTHWKTALRDLIYIKSSSEKKYSIRNFMSAFSDPGYAGNKGDTKSTTGYFTVIEGNLVK